MTTETDTRTQLQRALREALKARETVAASALRSALAAIGNAEAVLPRRGPGPAAGSAHVAGAVEGLGAGEAERRLLTEADLGEIIRGEIIRAEIIRAEITERKAAAGQYDQAGHPDRAARLRHEADVLASAVNQRRDAR